MAWLKKLQFSHPFLAGLFPVLFLYSRNVTEVRFSEIFLPLGLIACAVAIGCLILMALVRDRHRRALVLTTSVVLFFLYGPLLSLVADAVGPAEAAVFTPERMVMAGLLTGLIVISMVILRTRRDLGPLTRIVTQVILSLLAIQIAVAGYGWSTRGQGVSEVAEPAMISLPSEHSPDIYYLILDGYARSDILKDIYDIDNQDFRAALAERGFYLADSSRSNYNSTAQSLSSALNMNYLHRFMPTDRRKFSRLPTAVMLENNRVMNHLKRYGYKTVSFSTGYAPTEIEFADYYYSPGWSLSEFQNHLLNLTPIPFLTASFKSQFDLHRERLDYILTKLTDLTEVPSPKFVFAHISCPHPPFVFGPNGESVQRDWPFSFSDGDHYFDREGNLEEYHTGYRNQVAYISTRILKVIDSILVHTSRPPAIILQADHGPGSRLHWQSLAETDLRERFSILNAYLLPGVDSTDLYPGISPVNSFRVVLNLYFGTEFQRLPDRGYFTTWTQPYNYIDITDSL